MSLPPAPAPVAVLVLAWDETTPAVRALVEATEAAEPTVDSLVVLVPAGPAASELTPEEFLPLDDNSLLAEIASPTAAVADQPQPPAAPTADSAPPVLPPAPATSPTESLSDLPPAPALPSPTADAAELPQPALPAAGLIGPNALAAAALDGPAVRVLRLGEFSLAALAAYTQQALPAPTWRSTAAGVPAAPYLGSSATGTAAAALPTSRPADISATEPALAVPDAESAPAEAAPPTHRATPASPSYPPTEPAGAPDAEPDTLPAPIAALPAPTAAASTTELLEEETDELSTSFTADVSPVQAGWPAALAALQAPAAPRPRGQADELPTTPSQAPPAAPDAAPASPAGAKASSPVAALLPVTNRFDAPNLNFQIIQYARFAVPLALATQPFDVIYAPTWPTWLAAQELRQRTGQPLVLHVTALAAEAEPVDFAAGWPAEIQRQALHRADLILTETPALAYRLRHELGLPAHRVRPVPAADAEAVAQALGTIRAQGRPAPGQDGPAAELPEPGRAPTFAGHDGL